MTRFVIAFLVVVLILLGGLMGLLRNWRQPLASPEALERAKQRNREIEERESRDDE